MLTSLMACAKLPPAPAIYQCGYSIKFNKFRCVNTKTKEKINLSRDNPRMEAAQCLSAEDFKAAQAWVAQVKATAERRCQ